MRLLSWLVIALLALIAAIFAVSNRVVVTLTFWPFPFELTAALYLVVLLTVLFGFLLGLVVAWISGWRVRRTARERGRRVEVLERELAACEERVKTTAGPIIPHA